MISYDIRPSVNGEATANVVILDDVNSVRIARKISLRDAVAVDGIVDEVEMKLGADSAGTARKLIDDAVKESEESTHIAEVVPSEVWPDPQPLPNGLPPVMPFDFELLPLSLHDAVKDISDRMQCPPDYVAATYMIIAGSLIGRKVGIRPKRHDDWTVIPNLYGAMIGRPSLMKSPAMKEPLKFLVKLEIESKQEYAELMNEHEAATLVAEAKVKVCKQQIKKAVEESTDAMALAQGITKNLLEQPVRKRFLVNNSTVEKLGEILRDNPNGVTMFLDELVELLRTMDRDGHESDRGFYLTAWAGDSRYIYDRIGRGTTDIEAAIVSIIGSIQPGVISEYLQSAVNGGKGDDGMMPRFQMTVWPDAPTTWVNVDRYPNADAKSMANAALKRLHELTAFMVEAEQDHYERETIPYLRFDRQSQAAFDRWRHSLEIRLRDNSEHPAIESHLAKYRSLIPSLALIHHLLDGGTGPVAESATLKAIQWGEYLESHARRLYSSVTNSPAVAARLLAKRIQSGDLSTPFTQRDVSQKHWSGLDKSRTENAVDILLSVGWIEEREERTKGRPKVVYAVNPKIPVTAKQKNANEPSDTFDTDALKDIHEFEGG